jgi:hypothetical protein
MAKTTRSRSFAGRRLLFGLPLCLLALSLAAAAPLRAEPFRFPWDPPEPQRPARAPLSAPEVRSVLAREGAQMTGAPTHQDGQTVAIGRDSAGNRSKFILDANGRVIDVEPIATPEKARRRAADKPRDPFDDLASPERPLSPPRHSLEGLDDLPQVTKPAVDPTVASVKPGKSVPAVKPAPAPGAIPDPDAALSPVKPLHPAGAPKIEPLPQ